MRSMESGQLGNAREQRWDVLLKNVIQSEGKKRSGRKRKNKARPIGRKGTQRTREPKSHRELNWHERESLGCRLSECRPDLRALSLHPFCLKQQTAKNEKTTNALQKGTHFSEQWQQLSISAYNPANEQRSRLAQCEDHSGSTQEQRRQKWPEQQNPS